MAHENGMGFCWLTLGREARMVAYLACKERSGKVKLKELKQSEAIRDALLADVNIDQKTGQVDWVLGTVKLNDQADFEQFCRMVRRHLEDDGVDFDLGKGALELIGAIERKESEIRHLDDEAKALEAAPKPKQIGAD